MKLRIMLAVLAVTSCSAPQAQPPAPTTTTQARSPLPQLEVAAEATWTSHEMFDAQLRDGTALVIGHKTFQVIDTATGDVRDVVLVHATESSSDATTATTPST